MTVGRYSVPAIGGPAGALRRRLDPRWSPAPLIAAAAVLSASMAGMLMATRLSLGVALVIAALYAPLVAFNLPAAIAVWAGVLFIRHLSFVSIGPNAAGLLIAGAWIATLRSRRETVSFVLRRHRRLLGALAMLLVWLSLSLAWSTDATAAARNLWPWYVAALVFVIVATTISAPAHVRLVASAFVVGAVASVLIGLAGGGLNDPSSAIERATAEDGRLAGGGGDPNFLAAGLIPAIALGVGLVTTTRNVIARWFFPTAIVVLAVGLAATQSRAGLVASVVAVLAAFAVFRHRRLYVVALIALVAGASGLWFATYPNAWERTTSFDDGGAGRIDIWRVAWRMSEDHPVVGVGLNNFRVLSPEYVREPGSLEAVDQIVDRPHVVHNLYLQLLTETGIPGLLLYLAAVAACLAALARAAERFDVGGDTGMATLTRATLVGAIAMLAAGFFISYASDSRLWLLLGLGPALLAIARKRSGERQISSPPWRQSDSLARSRTR